MSQRNEQVAEKIRTSKKRYYIVAPPGSGKSTAIGAYPELMADVDCFIMRRLPESPLPPEPWLRDPTFPVNFVRALIDTFKTHPVILVPMQADRDNTINLIMAMHSKNPDLARQYVYNATLYPTPATSEEVDKLTAELLPLLDELRGIDFEPVIVIPDKDYFDFMIATIKERDKQFREQGKLLGREFRGMERETEGFNKDLELYNRAYQTGLFSKIPIRKGQYLLEALNKFWCIE